MTAMKHVQSLNMHEKKVHALRDFKCMTCKNCKKKCTKLRLNAHIGDVHSEKVQCTFPGYDQNFSRKDDLHDQLGNADDVNC